MPDPWNALLDSPSTAHATGESHAPSTLPAPAVGPLTGRTFVVKDVFDIEGDVTGAGCPALRARSAPATRTAPAVLALLAAGASCVGRARSDELAFSLGGINDADGTPLNPAAPGRTPGGSSSGSAAAVAGGLADIGLGTDTAGSIRVPASYCGLVGLRPTHGRVPVDGLVPLAPSYDTVGWLTRDGVTALDAGRALVPNWRDAPPPRRLLLVDDLLPDAAGDRAVVVDAWRELATGLGAVTERVQLGATQLADWVAAFHVLRAAEAWAQHGAWLDSDDPLVSPAIVTRIRSGAGITAADIATAGRTRADLIDRLDGLLAGDGALVVPASAVRAPLLSATAEELDDVRQRTLRLTAVASLAGAPSIALPATAAGEVPFGVALIGRPGDDESLLTAAAELRPATLRPATLPRATSAPDVSAVDR